MRARECSLLAVFLGSISVGSPVVWMALLRRVLSLVAEEGLCYSRMRTRRDSFR